MRILRSKLPEKFGKIIGGVWEDQSKWMVSSTLPKFLEPYWRYNGLKVTTIYMNKTMVDPFFKALKLVEKRKLESCIQSFDGCFALRKSRRNEKQSVHSWGMAFDINASTNRLGEKPTIDLRLVHCFEEYGFVWGGRWKCPDGMHFQYVTEDVVPVNESLYKGE
jgi:hypothetical protein